MEYLVLPRRLEKMKRVLQKRQKDLVLFMDNVKNEHNFSALIRTADAVGVFKICFYYEGEKSKLYNEAITQGAHQWIFLERVEDAFTSLKEFKRKGFQILMTWLGEESVDYREVDYTKPSVIVVGNELEGVSPELLPLADYKIKIPMKGMVQSLNVSVATGVILYEALRQREKAGLYDKPTLTEKEIEEILKKWAYENIIHRRY